MGGVPRGGGQPPPQGLRGRGGRSCLGGHDVVASGGIECITICQSVWKFKLWPVGLVQFCLQRNEVTGLGSGSVTRAIDLRWPLPVWGQAHSSFWLPLNIVT